MAVTHSTTARNAACNAVVDLLDTGSANAAGLLELRTAGDVEVASLPLTNPAFGAASTGTATAAAITSDTSATGGTTTRFALRDRDRNDVILGAVGTGGSDINLSSTAIGVGDTVQITALTYTAPA